MRHTDSPTGHRPVIGERMEGQDMTSETSGTGNTPSFPAIPAKVNPTTQALWPEAEKAFDAMTKAVKVLESIKGSAGEFLARAKAEVLDSEDGAYVSALVEDLVRQAAEGQAFLDNLYAEKSNELMKDLTPRKDAATATFSKAKDDLDAALRFLTGDKAAAKVLGDLVIPTPPKASGGRTGGSSTVKVTGLRYWRQLAGQAKEYQGPSQNKVSTMAYHYAGCVLQPAQDKGNMAGLEAFAKTQGVDVKAATPWTLTLPNGTVLGADKVDDETSTD